MASPNSTTTVIAYSVNSVQYLPPDGFFDILASRLIGPQLLNCGCTPAQKDVFGHFYCAMQIAVLLSHVVCPFVRFFGANPPTGTSVQMREITLFKYLYF